MNLRTLWARLWRGGLMGLAEVVPGVSGGTIALLTGIYRDLVDAIATFGPQSIPQLKSPSLFFSYHRLEFLLSLGVGMLLGIVLFANLMSYLLVHYSPAVWAFFLGVILVSAYMVAKPRAPLTLATWGGFGLIVGVSLLMLPTFGGNDSLWLLFVGGAIAVCAWILPAVSGSYMMLLLGLYETVIRHIAEFNLLPLMVLALGCGTGLLCFVRFLSFLLREYYERTLSLLAGFMLGSTVNLWPWRVETVTDGESVRRWLSPSAYEAAGEPAFLYLSLLTCVLGGVGLWLLARRTEL